MTSYIKSIISMLTTYKEVSENTNPRFKRYEHGEVWIGQDGNSRCYLLKTSNSKRVNKF
jgi:hypothetical protein